ncbi:MAG: hypothetical protein ACYTHJ_14880 [Planctomycetota bacterium]|jgi:hypothetical protein
MKTPPLQCPKCGSRHVIPIVYGLPSDDAIAEAEAGKIYLGGCCVFRDDPEFACGECEWQWNARSQE